MKWSACRAPLSFLFGFTLLLGGLYPVSVTLIAQATMRDKASGSVLRDANGTAVGSSLIGQEMTDPRFFWGRPSATRDHPTNGKASGASHLNPAHPFLKKTVLDRLERLRQAHGVEAMGSVPVDLVTASGSGLDPHISLAAAAFQAHRVAQACGLSSETVEQLIAGATEAPLLSFLGPKVVNVLRLNLSLQTLCSAEEKKG